MNFSDLNKRLKTKYSHCKHCLNFHLVGEIVSLLIQQEKKEENTWEISGKHIIQTKTHLVYHGHANKHAHTQTHAHRF